MALIPRVDWVSVLEAAYRLDGSEADWLRGLLARLEVLDGGHGVVAQVFCETPRGAELERVVAHGGSPELAAHVEAMTRRASPELVARLGRPSQVTSMRRAMRALGAEEVFVAGLRAQPEPQEDVCFVAIHDGDGHLLALSGGRGSLAAPLPHAERLRCAASHVGAALRIRRRLGGEDDLGDAVFSPGSALEHATERGRGARERLAEAVARSERARGRARHRPDEALALWQGLVAGRWSLVDRVERDGKRFVVAHWNEPRVVEPRGLAPREAMVAEALGRGSTLKEIAYELGLGVSAVNKAAARARAKLGLRTLGELAALFAPATRRRARALEVAGERFVAASLGDVCSLEGLSPAERDVAERAARGESNRAIARARGTSLQTVAKQLGGLFAKLRVGSRTELARRLAGEE
ncbi:MAG: helix-turn-helix transcriptional regulator [Polyangiales bacterium]